MTRRGGLGQVERQIGLHHVQQEKKNSTLGLQSTIHPIQESEKKAGRNDPCPCGSRMKYKKCCL